MTLKEINNKLDELPNYINFYTTRKINESYIKLRGEIPDFDTWYRYRERFLSLNNRQSGRTYNMIQDIISKIVSNLQFANREFIIYCQNINHGSQIINELNNILPLTRITQTKFHPTELPNIKIELMVYYNIKEKLRGRRNLEFFIDHYNYEF